VGSEEGAKCSTVSGRGGVFGAAAVRVGGGGGGARSGFRRKKKVRRADRADLPVSEGEATGQDGSEGKGGGRAEIVARAEIQGSKRKSILMDF
jgi:hypothetical protein